MNNQTDEYIESIGEDQANQTENREGLNQDTIDFHYLYGDQEEGGNEGDNQQARYEVNVPWRRYFARSLDVSLYSVLWSFIIIQIFHISFNVISDVWTNIIETIISLVMMLLLEPLLLSKWGTTPGKWIMGLRLRTHQGQKLSYGQGLERTFGIIRYGYGFQIPIYSLYRLYKSYEVSKEGQRSEWDDDFEYILIDKRPLRIIGMIGGHVVVLALAIILVFSSMMPPNRGPISVEDFAENYNYYSKEYEIGSKTEYMNDNGQLVNRPNDSNTIIISGGPDHVKPQFEYNVVEGQIKSMKISYDYGENNFVICPLSRVLIAQMAYLKSDKAISMFDTSVNSELVEHIQNLYDEYDFVIGKTHIFNKVEFQGLDNHSQRYFIPDDSGEDVHYHLEVYLERIE